MRNNILISVLLALLFALAGCQAPWLQGGAPYTTGKSEYTLRTPAGWVFSAQPPGNIIATKDGVILQQFTVEIRAFQNAFPASKRALRAGLTPLELAEAFTDDMRANRGLLGLEVKETKLAQIDGRAGFKVVVSFHTNDKLRLSQVIYGCIEKDRLYLLRLAAPTRYYFDRDSPAFEEAVKSFHFGKHASTAAVDREGSSQTAHR